MKETTPSIGILGCGFVGSAILNGFKYYTKVKVYDKFKENLDSLEDVVSQKFLLPLQRPQQPLRLLLGPQWQ